MHLDAQDTIPLAGFAATTLDVERETPRLIAAHFGFRQPGKKVPDISEQPGIGGRVGSWRTADRRLIDIDDLVKLLKAFDSTHRTGPLARTVKPLGQSFLQGIQHQRRLTGTGDAGDTGHHAKRDIDIDGVEIVGCSAPDAESAGRLASLLRQRDLQASGKIVTGQRPGVIEDLLRRPLGDHLAAMAAGPRPHVNDMIRLENGFFVMFNHQHGVAEITQALECLQQAPVITLMQPDRRFVENVKNADQRRPDLRC